MINWNPPKWESDFNDILSCHEVYDPFGKDGFHVTQSIKDLMELHPDVSDGMIMDYLIREYNL